MCDSNGNRTETAIQEMLKNESIDLAEVISNPNYKQGIRINEVGLLTFLFKQENFQKMINFLFPDSPSDFDETKARNALVFFTANSYNIQERIRENPAFIDKLHMFLTNEYPRHPKMCGYFQRIIEIAARQTNGNYIAKIPHLTDYLIENIHSTANRELLGVIITDYPRLFLTKDILKELTKVAKIGDGYNAISLIKHIIKMRKDFIELFDDEEIVNNLLEVGENAKRPITSFNAYTVLYRIVSFTKNKKASEVVSSRASQVDLSQIKAVNSLATAVRLFKVVTPSVLLKIFEYPSYSLLDEAVLEAIREMPDAELARLDEELKLKERVMEWWPRCHGNHAVPELGLLLRDRAGKRCKEPESEWSVFAAGPLAEHIAARDGSYGGARPREDSSDTGEIVEAPAPFVAPEFEDISDTSSSDYSSDEENDKGGYENAKYFAKLAGMDDLYEELDEAQKKMFREMKA